jgi:uncharacterized membrane protein
VAVSVLSNLGKLVPLFFYRDRKVSERLALSISMFTRGEVGAGVIFIALGYSLGGPALIISVLTLVLNLILTGVIFIALGYSLGAEPPPALVWTGLGLLGLAALALHLRREARV